MHKITNNLVCLENFDRKFPVIIRIGKNVSLPATSYLHSHPDYSEIVYVENGVGSFHIHDKTYEVESGDIIIINHNVLHSSISSNSGKEIIVSSICVNNIYLIGLPVNDIIPNIMDPIIKRSKKSEYIVELFLRVIEEIQNEDIGYASIVGSLMMAMFGYIRRNFVLKQAIEDKGNSRDLALTIKEYIHQNFREELSLESIAEKFYISTYYLSHLMKDEFSISPIQYIMQLRIGEAQNLLGNSDLTVSEIAYSVGYKNVSYFTILFKRHTGMTPIEYRNRHKTRPCNIEQNDNWMKFLKKDK